MAQWQSNYQYDIRFCTQLLVCTSVVIGSLFDPPTQYLHFSNREVSHDGLSVSSDLNSEEGYG
jgi:hypothetical protein